MNFLPAFYFPTTLVCVDDKQLALDGYKKLFADSFNCVFYKDPGQVKDFFAAYESKLSKIDFLNKMPEDDSEKFITQSAVQLDISKIIDLADSAQKHEEVSVLLADYYMLPGIDGLELCKSVKEHKVKKMLLTENQTYDTARAALNSGAIDYFANKTDPIPQIKEAVQNLSLNFFCNLTADFIKPLEANSISPLSDPAFISHFNHLVTEKNIVEYYLIDKNGSYLLIDDNKKKYVLIVHNEGSLSDFASILQEYDNLVSKAEAVKSGKMVPFLGIGKEVTAASLSNIDEHLFDAYPLAGKQQYYLHLLNFN